MIPKLSVVVATHNRRMAMERLLIDLDRQDMDPRHYEVVVVDDGSDPPTAPRLRDVSTRYSKRILQQANAGPGAARHAGVMASRGHILVFVDDDMQLDPRFLTTHLYQHEQHDPCVVLGVISPHPTLGRMPLFERFHAAVLARLVKDVASGKQKLSGVNLCTGNVSMRRADYLAAGGFDPSLRISEDRDLGIRLERLGIPFVLAEEAQTTHASDHQDLEAWLARARRYGHADLQVHRKNPAAGASPWRFLFMVSPLSRPILLIVAAQPQLGGRMSRRVMEVAQRMDLPLTSALAVKLTTLAYGMEYFGGLGEAYENRVGALRGLTEEMERQQMLEWSRALQATATMVDAVEADHEMRLQLHAHYHQGKRTADRLGRSLVEQIGFQMMAAIRVMQWCKDAEWPLATRVCSRLIRHAYGAEVHWDAQLAPGVCVVHGVGMVVSHAARVDEGCILFHNVTLGEALDPERRVSGAPHLEHDVHVGPGCTLLGPITVGAHSKIMAGSVLDHSVPPKSLVTPARTEVRSRTAPRVRASEEHQHETHH